MRSHMRVAKPRVESIEELRKICQSGKVVSFNDRVEREISIYVTRLLLYTGITANQVTVLDILIGAIACAFFVVGRPWYTFTGAMLLQLWMLFDYVDGEIARYRKSCSLSGIYLDELNHMIVEPLMFVCVSFGLFQAFPDLVVFALGFSAALSKLMVFAARADVGSSVVDALLGAEHDLIAGKGPSPAMDGYAKYLQSLVPISRSSALFEAISFMHSWGKVWLIMIASVMDILLPMTRIGGFAFNAMYIFLVVYGVLSPLTWIGTTFLILKNKSCDKLCLLLLRKIAHNHDLDKHYRTRAVNHAQSAKDDHLFNCNHP